MDVTTGGEAWYLTDEEWMMRENLREFVESEVAPRFRENATEETADPYYHEIMKKLGDMGYLRAFFPEEMGGDGMRLTAHLVAIEEVTRGCGALGIHMLENPLYGAQMGVTCPKAWEEVGEGLMDGSVVLAASMTAPEGNGNACAWPPLGHENEDGSWELNGEKAFSSGGTFADFIYIMGPTDDGRMAGFAMRPDTPGLTIRHDPEVGNSPTYGHYIMDHIHLEPGYAGPCPYLGPADAQPYADHIGMANFPVTGGALCLGAATAAWDAAVEYLSQRDTFGKKALELGAIQAKLVDMKIQIESCRSLTYTAARMAETNHKDLVAWGNMVQIACSNMATDVTEKCVEMFGNLGINPDNSIMHHHLDSIGFAVGVGTPDLHYGGAGEGLGFPPSDDPSRM